MARIDLIALLGIAIGLAAIIGGNLLEGGTLSMLINVPAGIIVVGGTFGAIVLQTPMPVLRRASQLAGWVLRPPVPVADGAVERIERWARRTRQEGLLGLEKELQQMPDPFVRKGMELIIDGREPALIRRSLEADVASSMDADLEAAAVFRNMGGYAPTIGIIGAVLGLIHVMGNLADPSKLGTGIATAFVATIYGVGFANLLLLPVADRLRALIVAQSHGRLLWIEGLLALAEGEQPGAIRNRLAPPVALA